VLGLRCIFLLNKDSCIKLSVLCSIVLRASHTRVWCVIYSRSGNYTPGRNNTFLSLSHISHSILLPPSPSNTTLLFPLFYLYLISSRLIPHPTFNFHIQFPCYQISWCTKIQPKHPPNIIKHYLFQIFFLLPSPHFYSISHRALY